MEFRDKLKSTRLKMLLSQQEFAKELGVAFSTLNRWENGHRKPTYKAQRAFRDFCVKHNINYED